MVITGRTQMLSDMYSITEIIHIFKEAGYGGIEMDLLDTNFRMRPDYLDDYFIDHIVNEVNKNNMTIEAVCDHLEYVYYKESFEFIKKAVSKVRRYGTDILITSSMAMLPYHGLQTNYKISRPEYWNEYKSKLKELLKIADAYGVKIAIEPEPPNFVTSTDDFLRLCQEMEASNLFVNLDVGHAFLTDMDLCESIKKLGDRIVHMHIENLYRGEHLHRLPKEGNIDLKQVFYTLKEIGYDGAMAVDIYGHDYKKISPVCVQQITEILSEVKD